MDNGLPMARKGRHLKGLDGGLVESVAGFTQSAPGLEWTIRQQLPAILFEGTAEPMVLAAATWYAAPDLCSKAKGRDRLGALHWALVLIVAISCVVVIVMKGPALVADPYPAPDWGQSNQRCRCAAAPHVTHHVAVENAC